MERTCERALELGLRSVAFTDHADFTAATLLSDPARLPTRFRRWVRDGMLAPPPMPLEGYLECLERCRKRFPDLKILSGVELSEPQWHTGPAASLLRQGQFDVVICGQHTLPHERQHPLVQLAGSIGRGRQDDRAHTANVTAAGRLRTGPARGSCGSPS